MKNTIILLIALLISTITSAQNEFEPGTIHLKDGSKQKGLIQFFNKKNYKSILFKKLEESEVKTFTTNQIDYYAFDNVDKKVITELINLSPVFLEVIIEGKASLLLYNDKNGDKRYFLKSKKSGLKELDIITKDKGDLSKGQFKLKRYVGILNFEFNDCENLKIQANNIKLTLTSLSKAFLEYNNCVEGITFKSERLSRKDSHNIVVEAGIYSSKINERGTNIRGINFKNSLTPSIGIHYIYTPTLFNSKTSLSVGASYNEIDTETDFLLGGTTIIERYTTTKINTKTINLRLGILYNFSQSKRKLRTNLGVFYINSRLLNSDSAYLRIDVDGNEEQLYEDAQFPLLTNSSSGFAFELGFFYNIQNNNDLVVKIGYQRVGDFLEYLPARYPSDTFTLKLGYSFNL